MTTRLHNGELEIRDLRVTDPEVVDVIARYPDDERDRVVTRLLAVGARGLRSMGLSVSLDDVDDRIKRSYAEAAGNATARLAASMEEMLVAARDTLDPHRVDSPAGRHIRELEEWRSRLLDAIDPSRADSHPGRLLELLEGTVGAGGQLEDRLRALLDPSHADSVVAGLADSMLHQIKELRDAVLEERGRRSEAEAGTRKGFEFEDTLDEILRRVASGRGWWVERTGSRPGSLHADARVGDFVVHLNDHDRIAVEAKRSSRITLTGADGILAELDRAMANRGAQMAVCVSADDAFPREVGTFGVYGNRILVVDSGDGTMVEVALRWAQLTVQRELDRSDSTDLDVQLVADRLQRLRNLAKRFSGTKRSLTQISSSIDDVRKGLDGIRLEVMEHLSDLESHLLDRPDNVVRLSPVESV